jgi:flagellar basal body rod protein FlgC
MFDVGGSTSEMQLLTSAANGMSAQRTILDLAARNVAAAQASSPNHPYSRLVAQAAAEDDPASDDGLLSDGESDTSPTGQTPAVGVRTEPGTGDALTELVAVLDAQRAFEQNASIFDTAKRLAERTIDIGRS